MKKKVNSMVLAAIFSAMAFCISAVFSTIKIGFPGAEWLHFDGKDVIISLCGFVLGPVYALSVSLVAALLEMFFVSGTGYIGMLMNFLSSALFACTASLFYRAFKNFAGAAIGLTVATAVTTVFMLGWNYIVTPFYMGVDRAIVKAMLLPTFLPFNAVKYSANAAIALLLYHPIMAALEAAGVVKRGD